MQKNVGVTRPLGLSAQTMEGWTTISRTTDIITVMGPRLHDMCCLSPKLRIIHFPGVQVMENLKKLTPENQKELDL